MQTVEIKSLKVIILEKRSIWVNLPQMIKHSMSEFSWQRCLLILYIYTLYISNRSSLINLLGGFYDTEWVRLMSAIVFTLNPNERQINTKTGVRERLCGKSRLKAHITQRELQNPITLVNKLTFARIMPLCPLAYFLGRAWVLQGLNKPPNIAVIALKSNVHWVALSKHRGTGR